MRFAMLHPMLGLNCDLVGSGLHVLHRETNAIVLVVREEGRPVQVPLAIDMAVVFAGEGSGGVEGRRATG